MDPEHNFDSDTSDSWFVFDINDKECRGLLELSEGAGTGANEQSKSDDVSNINGEVDLHFQNFGNNIQEINSGNCLDTSQNIASSSSEQTNVHSDCQVLYKGKVFQNDCNLENKTDIIFSKSSVSEAEKAEIGSKSIVSFSDFENDTDCISIISESEFNELKLSTYESDENCDEKTSSNKLGKVHPNVLKRKRKRLKLNYRESSEESVSGDFIACDGKFYSNVQNIDYKKGDNDMQVAGYHSTPVYRHYRNNVANTVLTLAMGVIFTGVACIAIGHFLGVHDAQYTAGEMMETLKRLQMENVLLHTRLAQLSRAFFSRGSSKLDFRGQIEPKNCLDKYLQENINGVGDNSEKDMSPIKNSIFFRGGSFDISTNVREPKTEQSYTKTKYYDKPNVIDESHDQLNLMNLSKYEENISRVPRSSTAPIVAAHVHDKVLTQAKVLKDSGDRIVEKRQAEEERIRGSPEEHQVCRWTDEQIENGRDKRDCLAIREKDLSRFRWFIHQKKKKKRNYRLEEMKRNGASVYMFPQPEEYYKREARDEIIKGAEGGRKINEMREELKLVPQPRAAKDSRQREVKNDVKFENEKRPSRVRRSDENREGNRMRKQDKKNEKPAKKVIDKNYKTESFKKNSKRMDCRNKGEKECSHKSQSFLRDKKRDEAKREKFLKGEKVKKSEKDGRDKRRAKNFRGKKPFGFPFEANHLRNGSCANCGGNGTSEWFEKWAKGREKCRLDQKISSWQFDRAKSRAYSRKGDAFWQFSRALGRETSRRKAFTKRDMNSNEFFSDAFSWI